MPEPAAGPAREAARRQNRRVQVRVDLKPRFPKIPLDTAARAMLRNAWHGYTGAINTLEKRLRDLDATIETLSRGDVNDPSTASTLADAIFEREDLRFQLEYNRQRLAEWESAAEDSPAAVIAQERKPKPDKIAGWEARRRELIKEARTKAADPSRSDRVLQAEIASQFEFGTR